MKQKKEIDKSTKKVDELEIEKVKKKRKEKESVKEQRDND